VHAHRSALKRTSPIICSTDTPGGQEGGGHGPKISTVSFCGPGLACAEIYRDNLLRILLSFVIASLSGLAWSFLVFLMSLIVSLPFRLFNLCFSYTFLYFLYFWGYFLVL
jgi:hypothetical protein